MYDVSQLTNLANETECINLDFYLAKLVGYFKTKIYTTGIRFRWPVYASNVLWNKVYHFMYGVVFSVNLASFQQYKQGRSQIFQNEGAARGLRVSRGLTGTQNGRSP